MPSPDLSAVFPANRKRWAKIAFLSALFAGACFFLSVKMPFAHGGNADLRALIVSTFAALLAFSSIFAALNGLFNVPRLEIDAKGLCLVSLFGRKKAEWDSIGPFQLFEKRVGRAKKPHLFGSALLTGPHVSANIATATRLVLPDAFAEDLRTVLMACNTERARQTMASLELDPETVQKAQARAEAFHKPMGLETFKRPWASLVIGGVLALFYLLEILLSQKPDLLAAPDIGALLRLGALSSPLVVHGQWFRLLTAPFLHGGLLHLAMNGIALAMAGPLVERFVGRAWFFSLYLLSGLGGTVFSLLLNPGGTISIGASGAIMGLFSALLVLSLRFPQGETRSTFQGNLLRVLIPSLLPLLSAGDLHIDYGAHLGGCVVGLACGAALLGTWSDRKALPGNPVVALLGTILLLGLTAAAFSLPLAPLFARMG